MGPGRNAFINTLIMISHVLGVVKNKTWYYMSHRSMGCV